MRRFVRLSVQTLVLNSLKRNYLIYTGHRYWVHIVVVFCGVCFIYRAMKQNSGPKPKACEFQEGRKCFI